MYEKVKARKERVGLVLGRIASKRVNFARWLLEKLLCSFFISFLILYDSIFGFQLTQSSFQVVYILVTVLSIIAYIISVVLVPIKKQQGPGMQDIK